MTHSEWEAEFSALESFLLIEVLIFAGVWIIGIAALFMRSIEDPMFAKAFAVMFIIGTVFNFIVAALCVIGNKRK